MTLGFAAGRPEDIRNHARYLRHLLSRDGYEKVRVLLPEKSKLVEPFEDAGYQKSGKILVYEKTLSLEPRSKSNKAQGLDHKAGP